MRLRDEQKPEPRLLGLMATAKYLGISKQTLYKLVGKEIPAFEPAGSRVLRFDIKRLDEVREAEAKEGSGMIISITNQKGGVSKTTTTINLGAGLVNRGYRVLLVDLNFRCIFT